MKTFPIRPFATPMDTPALGRVLRGTALSEDLPFAQRALDNGLNELTRDGLTLHSQALIRTLNGGGSLEDHVLARQSLNDMLKPSIRLLR